MDESRHIKETKVHSSPQQKYIPVRTVRRKLSFGLMVAQVLLPLHALTGCDTVLFLAGHSRKTAWTVFQHHEMLVDLGNIELTDDKLQSAQKVVRCIAVQSDTDKARVTFFKGSRAIQVLPPIRDGLRFHVQRVHYQVLVW